MNELPVYETKRHWVARDGKGFKIFRVGPTASERVATCGYEETKGLDWCKAEIARREAIAQEPTR